MQKDIHIIGAGMAGCEAAYFLARHGVPVTLHEMKPQRFSPAHQSPDFAELVCSNSLGSTADFGAPQMLKSEMMQLGSLILTSAHQARVPAGNALGVDRDQFSAQVTRVLDDHPLVTVVREETTSIPQDAWVVIATGPMTSDALAQDLAQYIGSDTLYFYDSISPIIEADSVDLSKAYFASRYQEDNDDYLNCPLTQTQYETFIEEIKAAEKVEVRDFEEMKCFEGCQPIEVLVDKGPLTLAFGPMKPVGLTNPHTGQRPYAVVQLRRENSPTTLYNMVGFQTRMKWGDQKRIFRMIPGLEKASFFRMGSMHRNTYIDSPTLLNADLSLKDHPHIFVAGQLTGVEGYVESAAMGQMVGLNLLKHIKDLSLDRPPADTAMGALMRVITTDPLKSDFSPMNINYGLLPPLPIKTKMKKKERRQKHFQRAQQSFQAWFKTAMAQGIQAASNV
jgi:methylenetetrahydrofolate--tRNA-(uracil-5-)-methyltransferase